MHAIGIDIGGTKIAGALVTEAGGIVQSTVYYAANISWRNEPFRARLTERLDLDITIDTDANAAGWLGQACASLSAILDPQLFVFGGGVAVAGELLIDSIRQSCLAHLPARGFHPEPGFAIAELVNNAGVVGAADLARLHQQAR